MTDTIATRVTRLISGGVHALIDAVENAQPEAVMEQALRELDAGIDDVRAELGRVIATKHLANKRLLEENRKHEDWGERIELAIAEGRDDLAEAAIARQIDIEAQLPVLQGGIAEGVSRARELEGYIAALQARRRELDDELRHYRDARVKATRQVSGDAPAGHAIERRVSKAENAFARVISRAGVATRAETYHDAAKLAELDELARRHRVRERLDAIKAGRS